MREIRVKHIRRLTRPSPSHYALNIMDIKTLLAAIDFGRARLLGSLTAIEKSGVDTADAITWRPGPARAHIAWQAMHCAATHDSYLNVRILGKTPTDPQLVSAYGGGSTPSDQNIPDLATIRQTLEKHLGAFRDFVASATPEQLAVVNDFPNNVKRSVAESIILLTWHETHHQGQIHLTWNCYKAAHGVKP